MPAECLVFSVCGLGTSIKAALLPAFDEFTRYEFVAILWLAAALIADLTISLTLVLHFVCLSILLSVIPVVYECLSRSK